MAMQTIPPSRCARILWFACCAAWLTGCAFTHRDIETRVETFSKLQGISLPSTYRLERLPSQVQQPNFASVEQAAEQSLARVGLTRSAIASQARWVAQISANAYQGRAQHPAYDGFYGPHFGFGIGLGNGGWGFGGGFGGISWMDAPPMVYYRGVKLVLSDPTTQQVVYETTAEYDDIRPYDLVIWTVLFDAALRDFPAPTAGTRQLQMPIPAAAPQAATAAPSPAPAVP